MLVMVNEKPALARRHETLFVILVSRLLATFGMKYHDMNFVAQTGQHITDTLDGFANTADVGREFECSDTNFQIIHCHPPRRYSRYD